MKYCRDVIFRCRFGEARKISDCSELGGEPSSFRSRSSVDYPKLETVSSLLEAFRLFPALLNTGHFFFFSVKHQNLQVTKISNELIRVKLPPRISNEIDVSSVSPSLLRKLTI